MKETRMKSELFTSCLGEKIIFGMEIQKPADTAKCLPFFTSYFFPLHCFQLYSGRVQPTPWSRLAAR